jgi:hypothetical protein
VVLKAAVATKLLLLQILVVPTGTAAIYVWLSQGYVNEVCLRSLVDIFTEELYKFIAM